MITKKDAVHFLGVKKLKKNSCGCLSVIFMTVQGVLTGHLLKMNGANFWKPLVANLIE